MTATVATVETVDLLGDCAEAGCLELAGRMKMQLDTPKYNRGAAIMHCPPSLEAWRAAHRTARKRADRSARLGYVFAEIDRSRYSDDIHAINTSLDARQGRPMSPGYLERREQGRLPDYPCEFHNIRAYGVLHGETLVAYMTLYRVNALALVSMILGHADHLKNDCMYALYAGMVEDQAGYPGIVFYNRWDSGQDGLRYYKTKVGFAEGDIEWSL